jgi:hypothetical protein
MRSDRRLIQLLAAPIDPTDGAPVFHVAHHSYGTLTTAPVFAWALVRYGGGEDEDDVYEVVEPVSHDPEYGSVRVGNAEYGQPTDVVLSPGQEATGVLWQRLSDNDPRPVGLIEVSEGRVQQAAGGAAVVVHGTGPWAAVSRQVEGPAALPEPRTPTSKEPA